jgi:hypothetical protein
MATVAAFMAIGGGAYALSAGSDPVRGGGKIFSLAKNLPPDGRDSRFLKLRGLGRIPVTCGPGAKTSTWGFWTLRAPVKMVTTDSGFSSMPDPNTSSNIAGDHHGFSGEPFGPGSSYKAGQAFISVARGTGSNARVATVTLSVLNGGDPTAGGVGNRCAFQARVTIQP